MCGTFIDTIIVCTITGLAIASSGVLGSVDDNNARMIPVIHVGSEKVLSMELDIEFACERLPIPNDANIEVL